MKLDIALNILSAATYGAHTTTELIRATRHSPTTVIRYLDDLEHRGWMARLPTERPGVGRPPIIRRSTDAGIDYLRGAEIGLFRKLSDGGVRILWGPTRAFTQWGVPFIGRPDIFADRPIDAAPFPLVLEGNPAFYDEPLTTEDGKFPALESLVAWAAKSGDPRRVAASAVLLRDPRLRMDRLIERAERMGTRNRVGFVAALARRDFKLLPSSPPERMLDSPIPVDAKTEALARRWHVEHPISAALVRAMGRLAPPRQRRVQSRQR